MAASIVMRAWSVRVCASCRPVGVGVHISRRLDLLEWGDQRWFLRRGSWWGRRGIRDDEAGGIGVEEVEGEGVADAAGAVDGDYVGHDCGCEVRAAWRRLSW